MRKMASIKAAVAVGAHRALEIRELRILEPEGNEILVQTKASGVCHTDIIVRDGLFGPALPLVLGHKGAGIVEAVGPAVTGVAVRDQVLMSQVTIPQLVSLHLQGMFPHDRLVEFYPFAKINEAITDLEHGRVIKPVMLFD